MKRNRLIWCSGIVLFLFLGFQNFIFDSATSAIQTTGAPATPVDFSWNEHDFNSEGQKDSYSCSGGSRYTVTVKNKSGQILWTFSAVADASDSSISIDVRCS